MACIVHPRAHAGQMDDSDDKITQVVLRDARIRITFAHTCDTKGSTDQWVIGKLLEDIEALGHAEVILKCDGQRALVQVVQEMRRRPQSTIVQHPPAYNPQSNGPCDKAVQYVTTQLRVIKSARLTNICR